MVYPIDQDVDSVGYVVIGILIHHFKGEIDELGPCGGRNCPRTQDGGELVGFIDDWSSAILCGIRKGAVTAAK
jgi:hypothetical protein